LLEDLRYVWRSLGHRPLYAAVTIVVFALAIGANATVFGVFNGLFLRPSPYPDDERLVMIDSSMPKVGAQFAGTSIPEYLERRVAPSLEGLAMVGPQQRTLTGEGAPEQLSVVRASPSLFKVLGVAPLLGRGFVEDESVPGRDRVVVLGERSWRTRFGARPDIVGQDVRLDGLAFRVVGVMPAAFGFPDRTVDLWEPFSYTAEESSEERRGYTFATSVGRLRPGATIEGLEADLGAILGRAVERLPDLATRIENTGYTVRVRPWRDTVVGALKPTVTILQGVVALVLLIASASIANLQLSRMLARRKELALRAALGAGQWRLARLVFLETLTLAVMGGGVGFVAAIFGVELVRALGLDAADQGFEFVLDPAVLGFTLAVALGAAVAAGALPLIGVWRGEAGYAVPLAAPRGGGSGVSRRVGGALVVFQVATSVALLVGAGLLVRSFDELRREGPGFSAEGVWTAGVALPAGRYATPEARAAFFERAIGEIGALPGVAAAGLTTAMPFAGSDLGGTIIVDGYDPPGGTPPPVAELRSISERYFDALGVPVLQGRTFAPNEAERVVVVTDTMARAFWPGESALGQRVRNTPDDPWATVVGVVPRIKHTSLRDDSGRHTIYWHYRQRPESSAVFAVRSTLPPEQLTGAVRDVLGRLDPGLALHDVQPLAARVARSLGTQRMPMVLTLIFAGTALALAIVGIYGLLTWAVTQRVGEIGVRMALGARAADVLRLVLGQGLRLLAVGLLLGVVAAVVVGRVLSAQLYGVSPLDPLVFLTAVATLSGTALVATWLPARRAALTDPIQALRAE
jgi:predicted permease